MRLYCSLITISMPPHTLERKQSHQSSKMELRQSNKIDDMCHLNILNVHLEAIASYSQCANLSPFQCIHTSAEPRVLLGAIH
jgi:hypothetical protein